MDFLGIARRYFKIIFGCGMLGLREWGRIGDFCILKNGGSDFYQKILIKISQIPVSIPRPYHGG